MGKRVNVEIDSNVWRKTTILAAIEKKMKREIVNEALQKYVEENREKLPLKDIL
ncbi:MAG: hypothetical protein L5656_05360 [Thermanaeromonas sp.]|uniref:hypothetical protein n=1 Tax=Thermanaeromonas sp. TaxID=2003697 RepID=UPI002438CF1F|nr:hypothetical protein [Thermanaeromonas sp.]MCG0277940.1 hypothetical protein [Thermanaeromonas sp.]